MDPVSEISNKLKAAITAKLMELGLYVDDQLPNYIMVMITNRRNKKEMDKDLQLFLGDDTNHFTTWLQSVWQKLEQVNTQPKSSSKRKSSDSDKKKKKKLKRTYSSDSESDMDKKKKPKSHNYASDNRSNPKSRMSYKSDNNAEDDNPNVNIEKQVNSRLVKTAKDISPDTTITTTTVIGTKTVKNEKLDNADKKSNTSREIDDLEDFLNIREEDIYDIFNDGDDIIGGDGNSTANKSKTTAELKSVKVESASSDSGNALLKATKLDKKQPSFVDNSGKKNAQIVEKANSFSQAPSKLKALTKPVKNEDGCSVKIMQTLQENRNKNIAEVAALKHERIAVEKSSIVSRKQRSASSSQRENEKRLSLEDDSSLDAREFINRKRAATRRSSPKKEPSAGSNVVVGRHNLTSAATATIQTVNTGAGETVKRNKYDKVSSIKRNVALDDNNKDDLSRGKNFIHSDNEIIRIKRTITNKKRYSSDEEGEEDDRRMKRKHILPSDTTDDGVKRKKKVDSMATLPPKIVRPKLSPTGSANTNLVRKAFEDVQRSLNTKEKSTVHLKRSSRLTPHGGKGEKSTRNLSPTIHEIKDEKDRIPLGEHTNKHEQKYQIQQQQQPSVAQKQNNGLYVYPSYLANDIDMYEHPKAPKPLAKSLESHTKPLKESMVQRVINMARSAARQNQPVEEYVPENTTPQFVVTLTGLDPNVYQSTSDVTGEELAAAKISNNIVIDSTGAAADKKAIHKKVERCKYWPNCLNAECSYVHPTTHCVMFPNCKFGNMCLYIHPKCKYESMCTRFDCPFTHTESSSGARFASAASGVSMMKSTVSFKVPTACKFYPNCINAACPFQHPKICRFDKFCTNRNCTFSHTSRNNMTHDKLKWTNPQLQNNATATAINESAETGPPTVTEQTTPPPSADVTANPDVIPDVGPDLADDVVTMDTDYAPDESMRASQ